MINWLTNISPLLAQDINEVRVVIATGKPEVSAPVAPFPLFSHYCPPDAFMPYYLYLQSCP